ncbi:phosphofructokinase domain-containing protein, partial [Cardiosporidium cionae]
CRYFIRISGGESPSHLCAECAVETQPTLVLIPEEIEHLKMGIIALTHLIADVVEIRANSGLHYGVVLLPDSLLESVPEMHTVITEIDNCFAEGIGFQQNDEELAFLQSHLTPWSAAFFSSLPREIQKQLAFNRDQTDKVDLTSIDTEILLKRMVETELARRKSIGTFKKGAFFCKTHFLAYQGRSALPSNFDCDLGYV